MILSQRQTCFTITAQLARQHSELTLRESQPRACAENMAQTASLRLACTRLVTTRVASRKEIASLIVARVPTIESIPQDLFAKEKTCFERTFDRTLSGPHRNSISSRRRNLQNVLTCPRHACEMPVSQKKHYKR